MTHHEETDQLRVALEHCVEQMELADRPHPPFQEAIRRAREVLHPSHHSTEPNYLVCTTSKSVVVYGPFESQERMEEHGREWIYSNMDDTPTVTWVRPYPGTDFTVPVCRPHSPYPHHCPQSILPVLTTKQVSHAVRRTSPDSHPQ